MPGTFRFFLAAVVALSHLVAAPEMSHLGCYAVRAFFVLSGFAMTAALNETYRFDARRFWTSRLLRIAPAYLLVCLVTAVAIHLYPAEAARFFPRWGASASLSDVAGNLVVAPLVFADVQFRYIEPAWSLGVEMIMYLVLWLGMARSVKGAFLCFCMGAAYHAASLLNDAPFAERYFTLESALFSFSLGALAYFWREQSAMRGRFDIALLASAAWVFNLLVAPRLMGEQFVTQTGYYLNAELAALVVVAQPALKLGPLARRIDTMLGELSYPVFLVQWVGGFVGYLLLHQLVARGWDLIIVSTPAIMFLSAALAWIQSRWVEPLRFKLRLTTGLLSEEVVAASRPTFSAPVAATAL
jgi:peptidoglycan/LPS O-acetylase OafA/YrhL